MCAVVFRTGSISEVNPIQWIEALGVVMIVGYESDIEGKGVDLSQRD